MDELEKLKSENESLVNKNKELLKDLKSVKETVKEFEGIDLDSLKNASTELETLKKEKLESEGEYKKLHEKAVADHAKEIEKLTSKASDLQSKLDNNVKKNALSSALLGLDLIPELRDSAINLILPEVGLTDDGEALIGDKKVSDYVKTWSEGDVGKHFLKSGDSGGDGKGSGGKGSVPEARFFDKTSPDHSITEQSKLANANPALYKELKAKYA